MTPKNVRTRFAAAILSLALLAVDGRCDDADFLDGMAFEGEGSSLKISDQYYEKNYSADATGKAATVAGEKGCAQGGNCQRKITAPSGGGGSCWVNINFCSASGCTVTLTGTASHPAPANTVVNAYITNGPPFYNPYPECATGSSSVDMFGNWMIQFSRFCTGTLPPSAPKIVKVIHPCPASASSEAIGCDVTGSCFGP